MSSHHTILLNGILLLLTLAHLAKCVPPPSPPTTQAHFNCPDVRAPLGFRRNIFPSLYPFCISPQADCDCYESAHPTFPTRYHPVCDMMQERDRNDHELQAALRYCEDTCTCYGGPRENWSIYPFGPAAVGPRIPITQLQNGYGTTTHSHSDSGSGSGSNSDQQAQARGRLTSS